jgi:hypothetical protein
VDKFRGDLSRIEKVSLVISQPECRSCAATRSRMKTGNASKTYSRDSPAIPA